MAPKGVLGKSKKLSKNNGTDWFEASVQGGTILLALVHEAAAFAPIPYLKIAAATTLKIVNTVQAVKDNKADFQRLAQDATEIIAVVWRSYQKAGDPATWPQDKTVMIEALVTTLHMILGFVEEQVGRSRAVRVIYSVVDAAKTKEYRERLQAAVSKFEVASHLTIQDVLFQLLKGQQDITARLDNQGKPVPLAVQLHLDEEKVKAKAKEEAEEEAERKRIAEMERMKAERDAALKEVLKMEELREDIDRQRMEQDKMAAQLKRWKEQQEEEAEINRLKEAQRVREEKRLKEEDERRAKLAKALEEEREEEARRKEAERLREEEEARRLEEERLEAEAEEQERRRVEKAAALKKKIERHRAKAERQREEEEARRVEEEERRVEEEEAKRVEGERLEAEEKRRLEKAVALKKKIESLRAKANETLSSKTKPSKRPVIEISSEEDDEGDKDEEEEGEDESDSDSSSENEATLRARLEEERRARKAAKKKAGRTQSAEDVINNVFEQMGLNSGASQSPPPLHGAPYPGAYLPYGVHSYQGPLHPGMLSPPPMFSNSNSGNVVNTNMSNIGNDNSIRYGGKRRKKGASTR